MKDFIFSTDKKSIIGITDKQIQHITIPSDIEVIGEKAFENCSLLESVEMPPSITNIEDYAFAGCSSLKTIDLPPGVIHIGIGAFRDCSSLRSIDMPDSLTTIGALAFDLCSKLEEVYLPSNLYEIEDGTFTNCEALKKVRFPSKLRVVGECAFGSCTSLEQVSFPNTVEQIKDRAYVGCINIKEINIPIRVCSIGTCALETSDSLGNSSLSNIIVDKDNQMYSSAHGILYDKKKMTVVKMPPDKEINTITLPESVNKIGVCSFSECKHLVKIELSPKTQEICDEAFFYSHSLQFITMSDSITKIGDFAFAGTAIKSIVIPQSVDEIGTQIFYECSALEEIRCKMEDLDNLKIKEKNSLCPNKTCKLIVPSGTRWAYKHHPVWGKFKQIEVE